MLVENSTDLTVATAQMILRTFTCLDAGGTGSMPDLVAVRQALRLVADHSEYQTLGVCADSLAEGVDALATYLQALGYEANIEGGELAGSVYIKFNPRTGRCHYDRYSGKYRGVLVSCQSSDEEGINETFGHLPLDLFVSDV